LNLGSLLKPADYLISQGTRAAAFPTSVVNVTPAGAGPTEATIAVTIGKGKRLAAGRYTLTVNAGLISDLAGNALAGTFNGAFPTGGAPGGTFQGVFTLRSNRSVAVTALGVLHPKNLAVRQLTSASAHAAIAPRAVHSAILGGLHHARPH
jgi:hypothetical protein